MKFRLGDTVAFTLNPKNLQCTIIGIIYRDKTQLANNDPTLIIVDKDLASVRLGETFGEVVKYYHSKGYLAPCLSGYDEETVFGYFPPNCFNAISRLSKYKQPDSQKKIEKKRGFEWL
jgi:hypothetical protein